MSDPHPSSPPALRPTRILLVEDNDAASRGLAKILMALGFEVTIVFDGTSALETLKAEPIPDVVLTDLRLPDLDGREVARFASRLVPRPRIALITGWDLDPEAEDYASWGIDWMFPKPLNIHDLVSKLREPVDGHGNSHSPSSESDGQAPMTT